MNDHRSEDSTLKHVEGETGSNRTHFPNTDKVNSLYPTSYVAQSVEQLHLKVTLKEASWTGRSSYLLV